MIEIYSTENCHFCRQTKEYLKSHNIPFTEYNVTNDIEKRTEMITRSNGFAVPVVADGKDVFIGFDKKKLDDLIQKYGQ